MSDNQNDAVKNDGELLVLSSNKVVQICSEYCNAEPDVLLGEIPPKASVRIAVIEVTREELEQNLLNKEIQSGLIGDALYDLAEKYFQENAFDASFQILECGAQAYLNVFCAYLLAQRYQAGTAALQEKYPKLVVKNSFPPDMKLTYYWFTVAMLLDSVERDATAEISQLSLDSMTVLNSFVKNGALDTDTITMLSNKAESFVARRYPAVITTKTALEEADVFISKGVGVSLRSRLINAARKGNSDEVASLIQGGANSNELNEYGYPPLIELIAPVGCPEGVKLLLAHGADSNFCSVDPEVGCPLLNAIKIGQLDCLKQMLEHGGDANLACRSRTPLMLALEKYHWDCAELLIEHGANINAQDDLGFSVMMRLCDYGAYEYIYRLLEKGADPTVSLQAKRGNILSLASLLTETPIFFSEDKEKILNWRAQVIEVLKQKGIEVV